MLRSTRCLILLLGLIVPALSRGAADWTKVKTGITLLAGFPFPARFNEMGTIHQPARPFFTPTLVEVLPGSDRYLSLAVRKRIAGVK